MSKSKVNTREKILDKALEMFNERGIEYVGLRELAGVLDMRVSNITYYFPTKDNLVYEISLGLSKSNSEIIVSGGKLTMFSFLEMQYRLFQNHQHYSCLLLSFVHLMKQNKQIASAYRKTQEIRRATIKSNFKLLSDAGYLKPENDDTFGFLTSAVALISRFWLSEAAISFRTMSGHDQIKYYLNLVINLLLPYTTPKGKKEMEDFTNQILNSGSPFLS
jgi:AcrR family transcriptional regulator